MELTSMTAYDLEELEELEFEELGELLLERLAEDLGDDAVHEGLEELAQAFEDQSWGTVRRHLGSGAPDVYEGLAEAEVDVRPLLAYLVGLTAIAFDGYTGRVAWDTVHAYLGGYSEERLRHAWVVALERLAPLDGSLLHLVEAWRRAAGDVIPDELALLEDGLLDGFQELNGHLVHMGELEMNPEDSEDFDEDEAKADERAQELLSRVRAILSL